MRTYIFIVCMLCGVVSGVVYDVLYIARCVLCGPYKSGYTVKDRIFLVICDFLYCLVFAVGFVFVSVMFDFENVRWYMFLGCALGAVIYLKSFHIIVAFFVHKVYNNITLKKEKRN